MPTSLIRYLGVEGAHQKLMCSQEWDYKIRKERFS